MSVRVYYTHMYSIETNSSLHAFVNVTMGNSSTTVSPTINNHPRVLDINCPPTANSAVIRAYHGYFRRPVQFRPPTLTNLVSVLAMWIYKRTRLLLRSTVERRIKETAYERSHTSRWFILSTYASSPLEVLAGLGLA